MGRFAIDAPTLLHIAEEGLTVDAAHQLVAPGSVRSEALGLLLPRVLAGELTERAALDLHEAITTIRMRLLNDRVTRRVAWKLALAHGWDTIRHAEHLALVTMRAADALVTVDPGLAALAEGVVPVEPVERLTRA